jgi:hypothetical protein
MISLLAKCFFSIDFYLSCPSRICDWYMSLEQREQKNQHNIKIVYDFTMALLWTILGLFLLLYRYLGFEPDYDPFLASMFGGVCVVYGAFRLWRGIKRKKENW